MRAIIGTRLMAKDSIVESKDLLSRGGFSGDAVENSIKKIEDNPYFKSVGYGGLPNEEMEVELDSAYMDGSKLAFGAIAGAKAIKNPISVARALSKNEVNTFLVGPGAEAFADKNGFERKNMLTDRAITYYKNKVYEEKNSRVKEDLKPYKGHDTVGICALDTRGNIVAGTSTSGLFMKKKGRVGDSPIIGSGLYADSEVGAASATGLGEDLMKGCISYEIVRLMKEGKTPQEACEIAVTELDRRLKKINGKSGDLSLIALNKMGNIGAYSNIEGFSFVYASETDGLKIFLSHLEDGKIVFKPASPEEIESYYEVRQKPVKKLRE